MNSSPMMDVEQPKTKIAYVVHSFGMGGLERCIARLVNGLDTDRFDTMVISLNDEMSAAKWITNDSVSRISLHKQPGNDFSIPRRLADVLTQHSIDIVHSHNWGTLVETTLARHKALVCRKGCVPIHVHAERGTVGGSVVAKGFRHRLRAWAMRLCMNRADVVMSNAVSVGQRVESRCGYPANRIKVIANGVESLRLPQHQSSRREVRKELNLNADTLVVGSVGRLNSVKGFERAIDAISLMNDSPLPHLLLVGDGGQWSFLQQRAEAQGVAERVHLVGKKEDVGRWLAAMDVYINTSHSEGMSQSIVEAMSVGLPLIVTDVGDNSRLAHGPPSCGIVVESGSPKELAAALGQLISDPGHRQKLARNALSSFQNHYQIQRMIDDYQSFYWSLIKRKRQS